MSGTPRRINTDRSLGTPSPGGSASGGGVPPRPPVPPQADAPQEDDGQSFFRPQPGDAVPRQEPAHSVLDQDPPRGKEPPRHSSGGKKGGGRKKKRFHNDLMQLLEQYQEQGFALGLKCGLMLAGELFYRKTL